MPALEVRFPYADYTISDDGIVSRTEDGTTWEELGPVMGLKEQIPSALSDACNLLRSRSMAYARLWKWHRRDITAAYHWMQGSSGIEVPVDSTVSSIVQDLLSCYHEQQIVARSIHAETI